MAGCGSWNLFLKGHFGGNGSGGSVRGEEEGGEGKGGKERK